MEWYAYDLISPIGDSKLDYNTAHLIQWIMAMLVGDKNKILLEEIVIDYEAPFRSEEDSKKREERIQQRKAELSKSNINTAQLLDNLVQYGARKNGGSNRR